MFNLFNRNTQCLDRLEEGFIRLVNSQVRLEEESTRTNNLLERVINIEERHDREIKYLYEEIKGLRTESLRIQRRIFGDEIDSN